MSNAEADPTSTAKASGPVTRTWALWDEVAGGVPIPRAMAMDLAVAEGINYWTARTQFQRWVTARKSA